MYQSIVRPSLRKSMVIQRDSKGLTFKSALPFFFNDYSCLMPRNSLRNRVEEAQRMMHVSISQQTLNQT